MAPLVLAGLSLLPKIPAMWETVSGLFGKKVPTTVEAAGNLAESVINAFKKGEIPPDIQLKLEEEMNRHEEVIKELALQEKVLDYENMKSKDDLEIAAYASGDEFVARTRPMILRKLFVACIGYLFYSPLAILATYTCAPALLPLMIPYLEWMGAWLFGTFTTAFLGYAAARTIDKNLPGFQDKTGIAAGAVRNLLKLG